MRIGRLISRAALAAAAVMALSGAANADILYQNPNPISSSATDVDGFTINFGFSVSDSFDLGSSSTLSSADFLALNFTGDQISAVDWIISSDAGGAGTVFGQGIGTSVSDVFQGVSALGLDMNLDTFSLGNLDLSAGTYWLTLENAVATNDDAAYWNQGGGSSQAWEDTVGLMTVDNNCGGFGGPPLGGPLASCAETFRINGTSGVTVPEPITLSFFGAGLVGAAALRRRKAKSA